MRDRALLLFEQAIAAQKELLKSYERPSEVLTFETTRALDFLFCRELFSTDDQEASKALPYRRQSGQDRQPCREAAPRSAATACRSVRTA